MMEALSVDRISLAEKANVGIPVDEACGSQLYPENGLVGYANLPAMIFNGKLNGVSRRVRKSGNCEMGVRCIARYRHACARAKRPERAIGQVLISL